MAVGWNFDQKEVQEMNFTPVPIGNHRVRIEEVIEKISTKGNPMYEMKFKVSGHNGFVWYYLTFDQGNSAIVNTILMQIFESFNIPVGNLEPVIWKGKVGGIRVKHEEHNGEVRAKVQYFLSQEQMANLPAWQDSAGVASATNNNAPFAEIKDDDIQF